MVIHSFIRESGGLTPVEVEIALWPGLPTIQFIGLPDQQIKESAMRIRSAIKAQGFEFPKSKQILVNLRPNDVKKTSKGLELAVALGYLIETGQINDKIWRKISAGEGGAGAGAEAGVEAEVEAKVDEKYKPFVYGELSLLGEVRAPEDLIQVPSNENTKILTGILSENRNDCAPDGYVAQIEKLSDFKLEQIEPQFKKLKKEFIFCRPALSEKNRWTKDQARTLSVIASGEFHTLIVGPGGAGKSTLALTVHGLLSIPNFNNHRMVWPHSWRPLIRPHHSISTRAMIGGGHSAGEGEITRAHGGILLLDEFLEFSSEVLENLREPLEEGVIHLARGHHSRVLPAEFQLIATSNLCPCGNWLPGRENKNVCRFSAKRCQSYAERFSGPLLDRFHIVIFSKREIQSSRNIDSKEILEQIEKSQKFRESHGRYLPNARISISEIEKTMENEKIEQILPNFGSSLRRRIATLRVARTLADLDQSEMMTIKHINEALEWTHMNFEKLSRWQ